VLPVVVRSPIATGVYPGCASLNAQVGQARPAVGEGSSAGRNRCAWVRGLSPRAPVKKARPRRQTPHPEASCGAFRPLQRGEKRTANAAPDPIPTFKTEAKSPNPPALSAQLSAAHCHARRRHASCVLTCMTSIAHGRALSDASSSDASIDAWNSRLSPVVLDGMMTPIPSRPKICSRPREMLGGIKQRARRLCAL